MSCRICFEDGIPETFVTPCRCSGTSAYIHPECLTTYFSYYPDRVCRVCHTEMEGPPSVVFSAMMVGLLGVTIAYSAVPLTTKLGLSLALMGLTIVYSKMRFFNDTVAAFLLSLCMTFVSGGHPDAIFLFLLVLYLTSLLVTIVTTRHFVLFLLVSPLLFAVTLRQLLPLDAMASSVYVCLLFLVWYAWIRSVGEIGILRN